MATITLPSKFAFTSVDNFKLQRATNTLRSRYTGQRQTVIFPFAVWYLDATLVEYEGLEAANIRSFLAQLKGETNNFRLPVPGFAPSLSGFNANGATSGAQAVRAVSILLKGLVGQVNVPFIKEGDYFTIQDELKIATSSVSLSAGGTATVTFEPPLRKAAVADTSVNLIAPTVLLNAVDDDVAKWSLKAPVRHGISIKCIEDIT